MIQVVAIDGVSGSGKSSTAKLLAKALGFFHLDTGAMYRTHTFVSQMKGLRPDQPEELSRIAHALEFSFSSRGELLANGMLLPGEIRSPEVSAAVSDYCKHREVRETLAQQQRKLGISKPCVVEGRDMGTVVFPDAAWKFYMTARPEVRAKRRVLELEALGMEADFAKILENLQDRDDKDSSRTHAPLKKAEGSVEIDTSDLTLEQQVAKLVALVQSAPFKASPRTP